MEKETRRNLDFTWNNLGSRPMMANRAMKHSEGIFFSKPVIPVGSSSVDAVSLENCKLFSLVQPRALDGYSKLATYEAPVSFITAVKLALETLLLRLNIGLHNQDSILTHFMTLLVQGSFSAHRKFSCFSRPKRREKTFPRSCSTCKSPYAVCLFVCQIGSVN